MWKYIILVGDYYAKIKDIILTLGMTKSCFAGFLTAAFQFHK